MKHHQKIYLLCLNPQCKAPQHRCLSNSSIHTHPEQCIHHLYPTQTILETDWKNLKNYPSDSVGKAIKKKLQICQHHSFVSFLMKSLKIELNRIIDQLQKNLIDAYPSSELYDQFEDIYRLDRIVFLLNNQDPIPSTITKYINSKFIQTRFNSLILLNECYDNLQLMTDQLITKFQHQIAKISIKHSKEKRFEMPIDQIKCINYGLVKSKYVGSSKIECIEGQVSFPRLQNMSNFLPWVYTQKSFSAGTHEFKITSARFPILLNAGFLVLQEDDIDIYPFLRYKSLFNKEGKNFELVEGTNIQQFINQTAIVKLRLELDGNFPRAIIFDSQRKCKYVCALQTNKKYRMGLYGSGWSVVVLQLT